MQLAVLLIVIAVIVDGLFGTQVGAMNLAGVIPWIHWRGVIIIGLLALGNVFCYGCPFLLPRTIARKLFGGLGRRRWPQALRSKWLAVALLATFLWAYEAFSLWDRPWITAWIAITYFLGALIVDSIFSGAAFCKYVCPIGQFNFVQSLVSPFEVKVRQTGNLYVLPHTRLHTWQRFCPRLRIATVPTSQSWQFGLHVLFRLRPSLPARQYRGDCSRANANPVA